MPMFTSCCPGWMRFVKTQAPELLGNISTGKSPQQMFGAITKTYFAEKMDIDPAKICCVSIMPCVAKKDECRWPTMDSDGQQGRTWIIVLTTRELARMIRAEAIDPTPCRRAKYDSPLGEYNGCRRDLRRDRRRYGSGAAYGLRTGDGQKPGPDVFREVRGMKPWKEAEFNSAANWCARRLFRVWAMRVS